MPERAAPAALRILVADDHELVRRGIAAALDSQPDLAVVAQACDGLEACSLAARLRPDVVVLDISMPRLNGLLATRRILDWAPETRVVALTMHDDPRFVRGFLEAGGLGWVLKSASVETLVLAMQAAARGETWLDPEVARRLDAGPSASPSTARGLGRLAPREREVLQLVVEEHSSGQIAAALGMSPKTVEHHRARILRKLGARSIVQLCALVVREGLVDA